MRSWYDLLQVRPDADQDVIAAAYRALLKRYHPDVNKAADASRVTAEINRAFEVLSDPVARAEYDRLLSTQQDTRPGAQQATHQGSERHTDANRETGRERESTQGPDEKAENLYEAILGEKNRIYYLSKFKKFDQQTLGLKASWNWAAFFGFGFWSLYRKMYGWFFACWGITALSTFFEKSGAPIIGAVIWFVSWIAFTIFANSLYHGSVKKKIAAHRSIRDRSQLHEFLRHKGGVHTWVIWVCCLLPVIGILAAIVIPQFTDHKKMSDIDTVAPAPAPAPAPEAGPAPTPTSTTAVDWNNKAAALWLSGKCTEPQKAIEYLNEAIRLQPDFAIAYGNRGNAYYSLGQYQLAISDYNEAIRLKPDDAVLYNNRGSTYIDSGNNLEGCSSLSKACELGYCKGYESAKREGYCQSSKKKVPAPEYAVPAPAEATTAPAKPPKVKAPAPAPISPKDEQEHFDKIRKAHPDYNKYLDDGTLVAWIQKQPDDLRNSLLKIYNEGDADSVIALLTKFKEDQSQQPIENAKPFVDTDQRYGGVKGIVLMNGNVIEGQIISMNPDTVKIRTKEAGILSFDFKKEVQRFIRE
jgi:tetratricopeptide (TPR) repeat protein